MFNSNVYYTRLLSATCLLTLSAMQLDAQDIGVGTLNPEAILHVKGAPDTLEVLRQDFESGLGDFTNTGIVNWSTTNAFTAISGEHVATSNVLYAGQEATLQLDLTLPPGAQATIRFHDWIDVGSGVDGIDHAEASFSIDGNVQFALRQGQGWIEKVFYLTDTSHTFQWQARHRSATSDDTIQYFLDDVVVTIDQSPVFRMDDGTQGIGRLLASDSYGNATWRTLNELVLYDNANNAILPMILDGRDQVAVPVISLRGTEAGFLAENNVDGFVADSNMENGFYANANAADGFYARNNAVHGFRARSNDQDGFHAVDNLGDGFFASNNAGGGFRGLNNSGNGFTAQGNAVHGFSANSNLNAGFSSSGNTTDGYYAANNTDYGFHAVANTLGGFLSFNHSQHGYLSVGNTQDGFHANNNGVNGFFASDNGQSGFLADNNDWYGFRADDNAFGGFLAFSNLSDGFQASFNDEFGFHANDNTFGGFFATDNEVSGFSAAFNNGSGYLSQGNSIFGFHAFNNSFDGFRSEGNSDGFAAIANMDDGFTSISNSDDGFYAANNGDDGFFAADNTDQGFHAYSNTINGFYSRSNDNDGFRAFNNGNDGFSSDSNTGHGFRATSNNHGYYAADNFRGFNAWGNNTVGFFSHGNLTHGFEAYGNNGDGFQSRFNDDDGIYSWNNDGDEGYFSGTVTVTGNMSKGGGSFKIDHPLDPENKYLYHSFVESPDMMNVYNGNVVLDAKGEAVVQLADWFEPLNRDFRYQLTAIGSPGPNLHIADEIQNNQFRVAGGTAGMKVSWQVTGIRQDPYAEQHRIKVEVDKPEKFRGFYLHPEAHGKSFERSFDYVKNGRKSLEELKRQ